VTAAAAGADRLESQPLFTVTGDLMAGDGSRLAFPIASGPNPSILVGGQAVLSGTFLDLNAIDVPGQRATTFLALTALDGLTMTNTTAATQDARLVPYLKQDANSLYVTLLNLSIPLAPIATNPNGASVGAAIDRLKVDATGDRLDVVRELTALDNAALDRALRVVSGEVHSSGLQLAVISTEAFTDIVRDQIAERSRDREAGQTGWGGDRIRWWAQFTGQWTSFDGTDTVAGGDADMAGSVGGMDWRISDRWLVGGGGGYAGGNMNLDGLSASSDFQAPRAFGYGGFKAAPFGARFGASAARSRSQTNRRIQFAALLPPELGAQLLTGGVDRFANAEETALLSDEWGEYSDELDVNTYSIDWRVGMRRAQFSRRGLVEAGAGALSLLVPDQTLTLRQADVRIHLWRREGLYRPFFETTYKRETTDGSLTTAVQFAEAPQSGFEVEGLPVPQNVFSARGGLTLMTKLGAMTMEYQFRQSPSQTQHSADVRVRFK
jgi:hypothetical protein